MVNKLHFLPISAVKDTSLNAAFVDSCSGTNTLSPGSADDMDDIQMLQQILHFLSMDKDRSTGAAGSGFNFFLNG